MSTWALCPPHPTSLPPVSVIVGSPYLVKTPLVKLDCREVFVAVHIALHFLHLSPLFVVVCALFLQMGLLPSVSLSFSLSSFLFLAAPPLSTMPGAILERNGPSTEELLALLLFLFFYFLSLHVLDKHVWSRQASCPLHRCCVMLCTQLHCVMQAGSWQT